MRSARSTGSPSGTTPTARLAGSSPTRSKSAPASGGRASSGCSSGRSPVYRVRLPRATPFQSERLGFHNMRGSRCQSCRNAVKVVVSFPVPLSEGGPVDSEHGGMSSQHEGMLPVDSVDVGQRTDLDKLHLGAVGLFGVL